LFLSIPLDVAKYIGKELGYEVKVKDMDFGGLLASLSSGKVDDLMLESFLETTIFFATK
jgi:ABC-type amino acid transport substrate-binding protein